MKSHGETICEVSNELHEPLTRQRLIDAIDEKYGDTRTIDRMSLGTDIAGCCVNLRSHASLPDLPLCLVAVSRGKYRRYDPEKDRHLNLYLEEGKENKANLAKPVSSRTRNEGYRENGISLLVFNFYDYLQASKILRDKGLFTEIQDVVHSSRDIDHRTLQDGFKRKGWEIEKELITEAKCPWDAYKDAVVVSIEFSLIDAVHRDFMRALHLKYQNRIEALVYITTTYKEPKFGNVKRDIGIFKEVLTVPIYLVGLQRKR